MEITIAERLRPYSHLPGTSMLLPGSSYCVEVFPTLLRFFQLTNKEPILLGEFKFKLKGPVDQFTVFNDLEKGAIFVSGKIDEGWFRYHLISAIQGDAVRLIVDKAPLDGVFIEINGLNRLLKSKEFLDFFKERVVFEPFIIPSCDRLSLGNHKGQDLEMIARRFDLTEILPLVHRLGQSVPVITPSPLSLDGGTLSLLEACRNSFVNERPEKGEKRWINFLKGCFSRTLVPQLEDKYYQGLTSSSSIVSSHDSPLILLTEGARLIRQLFVQQHGSELAILPYLFPSLHCGRLINVSLNCGGKLSLEWTKKTIRRLILLSGKDQECEVKFRSDVRSFRLREVNQKKGERVETKTPLFFKKNECYFFDNFL